MRRREISRSRAGWLLAGAVAVVLAIPFLVVTFPPITDLAQQTAQIPLLVDAVTNPDTPYRVQWLNPNGLSYLVLGLSWALFPPLAAGRLAMYGIGLLWLAAIFLLARRRGRPLSAAVLASLFFFNHVVTWGFYSFAIGLPVFVLWLLVTSRDPKRSAWADLLLHAGGGLLLYLAHALWFAAGGLWLVVWGLVSRWPLRVWVRRLGSQLPAAALGVAWFLRVSGTSFSTPPTWFIPTSERVWGEWLRISFLGSVDGPLEWWVLGVVAGWVALAVAAHLWGRGAEAGGGAEAPPVPGADRQLLTAAAMFVLFYLVLPDKYTSTILFAERWLPGAAVLAVLGVPRLPVRPALARAAALLLVAAHVLGVAGVWMEFEREELAGLEESLEALPEDSSVLGLSFLQASPRIVGRPFIQTFAYAQVVKGAELNFTFALFPSSLVVYDEIPERPWAEGLEWNPEYATPDDLSHFDHVLASGEEEVHRQLAARPELEPVQDEGVWRLYQVVGAPATPQPPPALPAPPPPAGR